MSLVRRDTLAITDIAAENFSGSLERDTAFGAGDFAAESISSELSLNAASASALTGYELVEGWNIMGWPLPYSQNVTHAFQQILGHVPTANDFILLKDNFGGAYLPEFGFNGVGDFTVGQGYQIKLPPNSPLIGTLTFVIEDTVYTSGTGNASSAITTGDYSAATATTGILSTYSTPQELARALNNIEFNFPNGWSLFAYPRLIHAQNSLSVTDAFKNVVQVDTLPDRRGEPGHEPGRIILSPTDPNTVHFTGSTFDTYFQGELIMIDRGALGAVLSNNILTISADKTSALLSSPEAILAPYVEPGITSPVIQGTVSIELSSSRQVRINGTDTQFTQTFIPGSTFYFTKDNNEYHLTVDEVRSDVLIIASTGSNEDNPIDNVPPGYLNKKSSDMINRLFHIYSGGRTYTAYSSTYEEKLSNHNNFFVEKAQVGLIDMQFQALPHDQQKYNNERPESPDGAYTVPYWHALEPTVEKPQLGAWHRNIQLKAAGTKFQTDFREGGYIRFELTKDPDDSPIFGFSNYSARGNYDNGRRETGIHNTFESVIDTIHSDTSMSIFVPWRLYARDIWMPESPTTLGRTDLNNIRGKLPGRIQTINAQFDNSHIQITGSELTRFTEFYKPGSSFLSWFSYTKLTTHSGNNYGFQYYQVHEVIDDQHMLMKPKEFNLDSFYDPDYLDKTEEEMQFAFNRMHDMQFKEWTSTHYFLISTDILGRVTMESSPSQIDDTNLFDASHYWRLQVNEIIGFKVMSSTVGAPIWSGDLRIVSIDVDQSEIVLEMADGSNFTDNAFFTDNATQTNTSLGAVISARVFRRIRRDLDGEYLTDYAHKIKKIYAPEIHNTVDRHYNSLGGHTIYRQGEYRKNITHKVIIAKNNIGGAFMPEFDFNGIGNFNPGEGYQVKFAEDMPTFKFPPTKEDNDELIDD